MMKKLMKHAAIAIPLIVLLNGSLQASNLFYCSPSITCPAGKNVLCKEKVKSNDLMLQANKRDFEVETVLVLDQIYSVVTRKGLDGVTDCRYFNAPNTDVIVVYRNHISISVVPLQKEKWNKMGEAYFCYPKIGMDCLLSASR